jgi:tripartite-type tricarboxylate transporter receptor subunit TctC
VKLADVRGLLLTAALLPGMFPALCASAAEIYPTRPVRVIVPFAPGGGIDSLARLTALELGSRLGQQFIVENQSGGGGSIGSQMLATSKPDGYTLIFQASSSAAVAPAASKSLRYDPIRAFAPVSLVASFPTVLVVNKSLPVTDLRSFVELLRSAPGKYSYGTAGPATISHLTSELFRLKTKTQIQHVPYRGMTPAIQDVLAGNITFTIDAVSAQLGNINAGLVRPLAVTSEKRSNLLPDVPTMGESGLREVGIVLWGAVYAPADTPDEIVQKLSAAYREIVRDPKIARRLSDLGIEPIGSSPAELDKYWKSEIELYRRIIADAGITLE